MGTQALTRNSIGSMSHIVRNTEPNGPARSRVVRTACKNAEISKRLGTDVNIFVFGHRRGGWRRKSSVAVSLM
jgi:hypothetical protein